MDYDRRVKDPSWAYSFDATEVEVRGSTVIARGDLLFLDRSDGLREKGTSTANDTAYPFSKISGSTGTLDSNMLLAKENFIGVAGWHSDSGVTEKIAILYSGLFEYPLKGSRHTKLGYLITPVGSGVTLYNQKVAIESSTTIPIGIVCDSGTFRTNVRFRISTSIDKLDL